MQQQKEHKFPVRSTGYHLLLALEWYGQNGEDAEAALTAWELANKCREALRTSTVMPDFGILLPASLSQRYKNIITNALSEYIQEGPCEAHDTIFVMQAQHQLSTIWCDTA